MTIGDGSVFLIYLCDFKGTGEQAGSNGYQSEGRLENE